MLVKEPVQRNVPEACRRPHYQILQYLQALVVLCLQLLLTLHSPRNDILQAYEQILAFQQAEQTVGQLLYLQRLHLREDLVHLSP